MSAAPVQRPDASDERYMAVLTTLARHGVRLAPERMSALVGDLLRELGRAPSAVPDWKPDPNYGHRKGVREKNPEPGLRRCALGKHVRPVGDFGTNVKPDGKRTPKTSCGKCLNDAQRNRYISARKMEGVLNAARLEFVADDDVAGLRCLDCHEMIVAGDEVVAETGLRHSACGGAA